MLSVGITGNIGSGKSLVCKVFDVLGVPVFHADLAGRQVLEQAEVIRRISKEFGAGVLDPDGRIHRPALAARVFSDPVSLGFLNDLVHPAVEALWKDFSIIHADKPYVLHEAAILMESGFYRLMDEVILVKAPPEVRKARVMQRDSWGEEEFERRASLQWSEAELARYASFSINNSGNEAVLPQVLDIHHMLVSLAGSVGGVS
ncbi:MAG TPA: dephospho-CoA kinase [Bacteroidales bacterium]|nr:dephospho-CoA kinase [Bacteroidales bacterium]